MGREASLPTRTHRVKVNEDAYADLIAGRKTFEVRRNDRYYQVGDVLDMLEVSRNNSGRFAVPAGRRARATVRYVHSGYGMDRTDPAGFVILGLSNVEGPLPNE